MIYYKQDQVQLKDYILLTGAKASPVSLDQVKTNLRIDGDDFDAQLLSLISVATAYGENTTGRDFINKTYKGFLDCFPDSSCRSIEIKKSKLQSITSIEYYIDGILTIFDSSKYFITESPDFAKIYLNEDESWPAVDRRPQAVVITFVAGYGDDSCNVPSGIQQAILQNIAYMFNNAGDCSDVSDPIFKNMYLPYTMAQKMVIII